jgi:hypothetical protein
MQKIYAGAKAVVVATETGASTHASQVLELLELVNLGVSAQQQTTELLTMLENERIQSALHAFCNDAYWGRIWIVQEYAVGSDIQLLIGDRTVSARKLHLLVTLLDSGYKSERWGKVEAIWHIRSSYQQNSPFKLVQILEKTRISQCGKRHDRVFGLMGLLFGVDKYLLDPDYEANLTTVTLAMVRAYIQKESLNIILVAPHCHPSSNLPSWCPDFYGFDRFPPDKRVVDLVANMNAMSPGDWNTIPYRKATALSIGGSFLKEIYCRRLLAMSEPSVA